MPDRDGLADLNPQRAREVYGFLKRNTITITFGLTALVYIYLTHLPDGALMSPLSTRNVLRIVLLGAFFGFLVFGARNTFRMFKIASSVAVPVLTSLILVYVWLDAAGADGLAREDRLIEDFSFALLMVGAFAIAGAGVVLLQRQHRLAAMLAGLLGIVFFVIGMEEISWFQHVLEYDSAAYFRERNAQGETNFHNLYTHETEDIFYLGGFLLLVVFPFFRQPLTERLHRRGMSSVSWLLPATWLITPFVLAGAFIYPGSLSRAANTTIVVGSMAILTGLLVRHAQQRRWWHFGHVLFTVLLFLVTATFLLSFDLEGREVRPWLGKEYQEFYIAWGIAAYGISVVHALGREQPRPDSSTPEPVQ